jgi:hypothetical protein
MGFAGPDIGEGDAGVIVSVGLANQFGTLDTRNPAQHRFLRMRAVYPRPIEHFEVGLSERGSGQVHHVGASPVLLRHHLASGRAQPFRNRSARQDKSLPDSDTGDDAAP